MLALPPETHAQVHAQGVGRKLRGAQSAPEAGRTGRRRGRQKASKASHASPVRGMRCYSHAQFGVTVTRVIPPESWIRLSPGSSQG